jgi:hypothetical protein
MKGRRAVFALVTCGWMAVAWFSVQTSAQAPAIWREAAIDRPWIAAPNPGSIEPATQFLIDHGATERKK